MNSVKKLLPVLFAVATLWGWVSVDGTRSIARAQQSSVLVPAGAVWKYLDNGSDQGTSWRANSFNDVAWQAGAAQLGYGDGDETTIIGYGPDANNKYITTYFRRTFSATNVATVTQLLLSVRRDDGVVVYLNGNEIWRDNMPAGAVNATTLASTAAPDDGNTFLQATLSPAFLLEGNNVLAVEMHQAAVTSSDVSFDLQLNAATTPPMAQVTRGPYLQKGTPSSLLVRWRTNAAHVGRVNFGNALANLTSTVDEASATTEHSVTLSNLQPNTTYYYSIGTTTTVLAGADAQHQFTTAPLPGSVKATRIWALGDAGSKDANQAAVRDAYLNFTGTRGTDVWLMLGDNAYDTGTDAEYQAAVFNMYPQTLRQTVLWSTLGNHETYSVGTPANAPYFQIFDLPKSGEAGGLASGTENYYSFDYGNIHFVCLDSMASARTPGSAMLTWLQNDLAANNKAWLIAFWHHPPYTKGSHDSDAEIELIEMRQYVLPMLENYGVDLVLTGHSHSYERSYLLDGHYGLSSMLDAAMKKNAGGGSVGSALGVYTKPNTGAAARSGAVYALAGSAGKIGGGALNHPAMFISLNELGSLVLDVNGNQLDAKFIRETGAIADSFRMVKGNALPTVSLASPTNNASLNELTTVKLVANANDSDGSVARVDFYQGNTWLGADTTAPYEFDWTTAGAGNYVLSARVTDQLGSVGLSGLVNVSVVPAAPTNLTGYALTRTSIRLNWLDQALNESGYRIERSADGINFTEIGAVGPNVTTFAASNLARSTQYYFRVRAVAAAGNSAYSNVLQMYAFPLRELIFRPIEK